MCEPCLHADAEYHRQRYAPRNIGKPCAICAEPLGMGRWRYCSDECQVKALVQSDAYKQAQQRRNAKPRAKVSRVCGRCGQTWLVEKGSCSRYCSRRCFQQTRRKQAALVHVGSVPFTWLPPQHPVLRRPQAAKPRVWCAGNCHWCGQAFVVVDQLTAKFCSPTCAKAKSRQARGRFEVPPPVRYAIYERDRWTCQLCMEPVDQDLTVSDPCGDWAPSLDHIVPQSKGGGHDVDNLRLAHRWCNAIRGDETYYGREFFAVA